MMKKISLMAIRGDTVRDTAGSKHTPWPNTFKVFKFFFFAALILLNIPCLGMLSYLYFKITFETSE